MMNYQSAPQLKSLARIITRAGESKGRALKLGEALDALAQGHGHKAWSSLAPKLSQSGVDSQLSLMEKEHVVASRGDENNWPTECVLQVHTGFYLRTPAYPLPCDYVRVCDPLGREIAYWHENEWQEDPAVVMGALVGALCRGEGTKAPEAVVAERAAETGARHFELPFKVDIYTRDAGSSVTTEIFKELILEDDDAETRAMAHGATEALEWFLMAMASEGIDLSDARFSRALQSAVKAVSDKTLG